jgi:serine/threonine-protein kinase HipA
MGRRLHAHIGTRLVGELLEGDGIWGFSYSDEWQAAADGFDLSPDLARHRAVHQDAGTLRPVQWYFDNLLPEEQLRTTISQEAQLESDDAFALLEYLGAESAGSLTLVTDGQPPADAHELRPLEMDELSRRIADLPNQSLTRQAPKRMSLAGAQHKLLVAMRNGKMFEPVGATPSTHILKPEHEQKGTYPASVFNEHLTMKLAKFAGLQVPDVQMMFVPQPVYIIERFDRNVSVPTGAPKGTEPTVRRLHIIDACQLLNKARTFKHSGATLESLSEVIARTTNTASTRLRLFSWLAFNVLVGNDDCHLKNLSFMVDADGVALAPHYDLLSTGAYHTKALADEYARWPDVPMAIPLPGAKTFGEVTTEKLMKAAGELGVPRSVAMRQLETVKNGVTRGFAALKHQHEQRTADPGNSMAATSAQSSRLLNVIEHITLPDMMKRLS